MNLQDPIAIYVAATNLEAHQVCGLLGSYGIAAHAMEDSSRGGFWSFGLFPQIHRPKVWVSRSDESRADAVIQEFERERRARQADAAGSTEITAACEECGAESLFPAAQAGTVQDCPRCGAFMDVGSVAEFDDWLETPADDK